MSKVSEYPVNTTPALTDRVLLLDDPAGTPAINTVAISYLQSLANRTRVAFSCVTLKTITNTNAETTMLDTASVGSYTFAANTFAVNDLYRITAAGSMSTSASPPELNIKAKFGSTVLATTGSTALTGNLSNAKWDIDLLLGCTTIGASGAFWVMGKFTYASTVLPLYSLNQVTVNTTTSQAFNLTAQWNETDSTDILNTMLLVGEKTY